MAKLNTQYQNTVRYLSVHPLSYKGRKQFMGNDFTQRFVLKAEAYLGAAGDLTKKELTEASAYIRHDMGELNKDYQTSVSSFKLSAWYQAWDKITWSALASITDKTQVEWTEVGDDLVHQGRYTTGDEVGFGLLTCVRCGYQKELFHPATVLSCASCDGDEFMREGFAP
ncbi:hypothetical protein [Moritella sp. F3]|uniref:zinc ribbon-containing protein n=1 Tax=Moritella sp. F3 TaxID=2718882 RepID=UPI001A1BBBAB|nr:hypothetical protein [Moritella sp. F3]GIC77822.1 hypothetical protein FMO001_25490 [Moritella sp. F1]GIC83037.1 hypothetical protein FMO003_33170 [Moritella sp. F3]